MRKPTLLLAGAIALFIAWALFSATNNALGFVVVTPYEAGVNKSGTVNAIDLSQVAQRFGAC